jgi:cytochrome c
MKKIKIASFTVIFLLSVTSLFINSYGTNFFSKTNDPEFQDAQADKGVGPFKDVKLGPVDQMKARKGLTIFMQKCFLCHELDNKKLGPPLRNITKQETPEFILNMIVNPTGMQKENDKIKARMKEFNNLPMTDQQVSQQDALNILDYLRSVAK